MFRQHEYFKKRYVLLWTTHHFFFFSKFISELFTAYVTNTVYGTRLIFINRKELSKQNEKTVIWNNYLDPTIRDSF